MTTALRRRREPGEPLRGAPERLAPGVPAADIPAHVGQAVEALDLVPLLAGYDSTVAAPNRPRRQCVAEALLSTRGSRRACS